MNWKNLTLKELSGLDLGIGPDAWIALFKEHNSSNVYNISSIHCLIFLPVNKFT